MKRMAETIQWKREEQSQRHYLPDLYEVEGSGRFQPQATSAGKPNRVSSP